MAEDSFWRLDFIIFYRKVRYDTGINSVNIVIDTWISGDAFQLMYKIHMEDVITG